MNDLADVNMQGVVPTGDFKELEVGTYLVRIEDCGKKGTKEKFDANGVPDPNNGKNFFLSVDTKVWDGPDLGHEEPVVLNLWNLNDTAVRIAKAELLAIQNAVGVHTANSRDLVGRWMLREVYLNRAGKKADKWLAIPANQMSLIPTNVPPVPATKYAVAAPQQQSYAPQPQQQPQQGQTHVAAGMQPAQQAAGSGYAQAPQPTQQPNPGAAPSWSFKK